MADSSDGSAVLPAPQAAPPWHRARPQPALRMRVAAAPQQGMLLDNRSAASVMMHFVHARDPQLCRK